MSTPPVPPNGNEPTPGNHTPQYGQNAPQYGQNAPQYGQQGTPQYGQNAPQHGQNAPQYGQNAPQYGQNAPQYGQNAPQYGQASPQPPYASPYGSGQPAGPGAIPKTVNNGFWLIVAAGAINVISIIISAFTLDTPAFREMFDDQMTAAGVTDVSFADFRGILLATFIVAAVIAAGLYALVAFNVRRGKNWARILGTVFAVISLIGLLPLSIGTIAVLLGIVGIVFLYLKPSAPYFSKAPKFSNPYGQ
ncbi:hypothetical protein [Pseudarthrobacter sp. PS3-L1]|uniref:hypothetical protein n=1 Tax=Pseudarthrobacter sp. PS3-L1 TaxID=3046207 RepID=UPI0024BA3216|nr:hypothetical protein [Pseudarthrobacter sp. PS3-L1]MDJ0319273.1 hypothetical protein [Pseudarthrobacter sp. PS3-L1]